MADLFTPAVSEQQKGRREAGLFHRKKFGEGSVLRDQRAAPAIVQADEAHVDVLTDAVAAERQAAWGREAKRAIAEEDVVVFDAHRPVRRKADFQAGADRATPTAFAGRSEQGAVTDEARGDEHVVLVSDHCA